MKLLPVEEAQARLLSPVVPVGETELLGLDDADGRVLAEDLAAGLTQPPFDASAMDGYALKADDAGAPGASLDLVGTSAAGHAFEGVLQTSEAVRIFTGAPVPEGADSVLLQEDAERDGERVIVRQAVRSGQHIRRRGQDFAEGEIGLSKGLVLDPARLLLAAGMNRNSLRVLRRPRIAVLATGDELVRPGETPGPSQIVASSTFGVAALARRAGAVVIDLGIVGDDRRSIASAVQRAKAEGADAIVTLGGASVGDHDLVQPVLRDLGMQLDFWRIAMRPGKPLMVGRLGETPVLGLPGNPVSTMVCALLFLEPLIRKLAALPGLDRLRPARIATPMKSNDHRQDYVRACLSRCPDGGLLAEPFGRQDSSMMKVLAQADCLVIRPPHAPALAAGETCSVLLLREPV